MDALESKLQGVWGRTANDEFKSRSNRRLSRSLAAAAAFHVILFVWSPAWEGEAIELPFYDFGVALLSLQGAGGGGPLGPSPIPAPIAVAESETNAVEEEAEAEPGVEDGLQDWSLTRAYEARGTDALRAALNRRSQPVPSLAEPELDSASPPGEPDSDAASHAGGEDGGTTIGGAYALSEFEALTEDELLALERLSALRPELAFTSPSSWILIRNPSELTEFLEERFAVPEEGAVSVAIWVDERGSVEWAEIQRSSGREDLDQSALELFLDVATFRPARRGGVNVPMALVVSLRFPW